MAVSWNFFVVLQVTGWYLSITTNPGYGRQEYLKRYTPNKVQIITQRTRKYKRRHKKWIKYKKALDQGKIVAPVEEEIPQTNESGVSSSYGTTTYKSGTTWGRKIRNFE